MALGDGFTEMPLQIDSFQVVGDTLHVWLPGELRPAETMTFRYLLMIDSAPDGVVVNEAVAEARRGTLAASSTIAVASNEAQALVGLTRNRAMETRTVLGKVFHDIDGNDDEREYEEHEDDDAGARTRARCEGSRATRRANDARVGRARWWHRDRRKLARDARRARVRRARVRMGGDL